MSASSGIQARNSPNNWPYSRCLAPEAQRRGYSFQFKFEHTFSILLSVRRTASWQVRCGSKTRASVDTLNFLPSEAYSRTIAARTFWWSSILSRFRDIGIHRCRLTMYLVGAAISYTGVLTLLVFVPNSMCSIPSMLIYRHTPEHHARDIMSLMITYTIVHISSP